jgi:predicted RNase H-like HicB family nuclease
LKTLRATISEVEKAHDLTLFQASLAIAQKYTISGFVILRWQMATVIYIAIVHGDPDKGYEARFPDLPETHAHGRDLAELLTNARQAVTAQLEAIENEGEAWPPVTAIENIELPSRGFPLPIDVSVDDTPIRVNVSLGERLVQRLDAAAEAGGMTRSGFIAQSVRVSLGERARRGEELGANGRGIQDELNDLGRRINESMGPDSPFARRMNELDDRLYDGVRRAADTVSAAMGRRLEERKSRDYADINPSSEPEMDKRAGE